MDLARYKELKEKGLVILQPVGGQVIVISKDFDTATGAELKSKAIPVDEESLRKQKATLELQLDTLTEFLADVVASKT